MATELGSGNHSKKQTTDHRKERREIISQGAMLKDMFQGVTG